MGRRLFDIVIPGAQKSGTSTLLADLGHHPDIVTRGLDEFGALLDPSADLARAVQMRFGSGEQLRLVKSAGLMHSPQALERLHRVAPEARIIFMLRDPVERIRSAYWFARRTGDETLPTLEDALEAEGSRQDVAEGRRSWVAYRARSEYVEPLRAARSLFGAEQMTVITLERYKTAAPELLGELHRWLGLDVYVSGAPGSRVVNAAQQVTSPRLARLARADNRFTRLGRSILPPAITSGARRLVIRMNERPFRPPPMRSETRAHLQAYFADHNRRLADEFGVDVTKWS